MFFVFCGCDGVDGVGGLDAVGDFLDERELLGVAPALFAVAALGLVGDADVVLLEVCYLHVNDLIEEGLGYSRISGYL